MNGVGVAIVFLSFGTLCFAFVIGGNLYEQVVCVPKWRAPGGLRAWRTFTGERHAGYFFLPTAAIALVCLATGTALGWRQSAARDPYALVATLSVFAALLFTRLYFIPRNRLLFMPATAIDDAQREGTLMNQWATANYVRVAISLVALASALMALRR